MRLGWKYSAVKNISVTYCLCGILFMWRMTSLANGSSLQAASLANGSFYEKGNVVQASIVM